MSLRVERRLQKIENEMLSHRQVVPDRREKQRSSVTAELQVSRACNCMPADPEMLVRYACLFILYICHFNRGV